jgi:hypothetical protein
MSSKRKQKVHLPSPQEILELQESQAPNKNRKCTSQSPQETLELQESQAPNENRKSTCHKQTIKPYGQSHGCNTGDGFEGVQDGEIHLEMSATSEFT